MIVVWVNGLLTPTIAFHNFRISRIAKPAQLLGKNVVHILQVEEGDDPKMIRDCVARIHARFKAWPVKIPFIDPDWASDRTWDIEELK
jgi:hypothetical protein